MYGAVAHLKTPKKLVVIDTMDDRLALAKAFGADVVINAAQEDAIAIVKSMTDGYGCVSSRSDGGPYRRDPGSGDDS